MYNGRRRSNTNLAELFSNQEEGDEKSLFAGGEENLMKFLDSMDAYLTLMNSLSSGLRQGWMELASARHSMGASRVNAALFDLKDHSASTTLPAKLCHVDSDLEQPFFSLHKWMPYQNPKSPSEDGTLVNDEPLQIVSGGHEICKMDPPVSSDMQERVINGSSPRFANDQAQKERFKVLSMFGTLVSPKLRSAQLLFETVVETVAEIANTRSSILCTYDLVRKETENSSLDIGNGCSGLQWARLV